MKRATLLALSTLFALGLAACDRPGSTDKSSTNSSKTSPTSPTPPSGTPPASKP